MNDTFSMSGVDIAGLVERLRDWHENWSLGSKGPAILTRAADALLAQAARAESAERQRDEALEALKAARGLLDLYREAAQGYSHAQWNSGWCRCYSTYKHREEIGPVPRPWEAP